MTTVRTILQTKGPEVWSVEPETPVMAALRIMDEKNIGALVVARAGSVLGILSERDAGHSQNGGFLLNATRISKNQFRMCHQF